MKICFHFPTLNEFNSTIRFWLKLTQDLVLTWGLMWNLLVLTKHLTQDLPWIGIDLEHACLELELVW